MQPDRWQRIEDLFHQALALEPDARAGFLEQNCAGDSELRDEIDSLIQAHEDSGAFITEPAANLIADDARFDRPEVIGPYRIVSEIGRGGMAEVYLAEDPRLGRKMALKILPDFSGQDPEMVLRFKREAQAASALNHPNILTIYDIGESEGFYYIATEYVEGRTVRDLLGSGPLKLSQALDVAAQVASALEAAHQAGIIHRDIKPENIMVRQEGLAKVLDFGLAKPYNPATAERDDDAEMVNTRPWMVMGTAPYMSPEQARGLNLDARSDLFSLGVVLYEMVTGTRPFEGGTTSDTLASILTTEPVAASSQCPSAPSELDRVLSRALAKDREQRHQTAAEFIADIDLVNKRLVDGAVADSTQTLPVRAISQSQVGLPRRIMAALSAPRNLALLAAAVLLGVIATGLLLYRSARESRSPIDSIAVMPFTNSNKNPDTEYLSDGITESLINSLSDLSTLRVMSNNVVSHFKGQDMDARVIGQKLNVKGVLIGTMSERGDDLTIDVELVDARNGTHVWGKRYFGRTLSNLPQTQEQISREVASQLLVKLSGKDQQVLANQHIADPAAYQSYLQGRYALNKQDPSWSRKAVDYFNDALRVDPHYPLAYAGLADSYSLLSDYGAMSPSEALPKAQDAAEQALRLDDTLAEAHTALGHIVLSRYWDWNTAEAQYKRALDLKPDYSIAHQWYANLLAGEGRFDEAIAQAEEAVKEEPVLSSANQALGRQLYVAGRYDAAVAQLRKALDLDPNSATVHVTLGLALLELKRYDEAIDQLAKAVQLSSQNAAQAAYLAELARAYVLAGERAKAEEMLGRVEQLAKTNYVSPFFLAHVYAAMNDPEKVFKFLNLAYEQRSSELIFINVLPGFSSLHSDARFRKILEQVKLPSPKAGRG